MAFRLLMASLARMDMRSYQWYLKSTWANTCLKEMILMMLCISKELELRSNQIRQTQGVSFIKEPPKQTLTTYASDLAWGPQSGGLKV